MLIERLLARRSEICMASATDGPSGLTKAKASRPDAILMDVNLPGISGVDTLRLLLSDPELAAIPVIALSASAMPRDIRKGLEAGFFRYLTKPIRTAELMEALDLAFDLATTTAESPERLVLP
jgi:CheY-like chemotaxis protein